jgi:hypothetical protein
MLSHPFPLPSVISSTANVIMPPRYITLSSHAVKMSSLHLLHLFTMLHLVASSLESKSKH